MNVSWIFYFTFLLLIHTVSVQSVRVEGFIGESVILPCSFDQKPRTVFWRDSGSRRVCDISGSNADCKDRDSVYKDRVTIFPPEIEKGNFSIMLSNLTETDSGLYTCTSPQINPPTLKLELIVTERQTAPEVKGTQIPPGNGDSPRRADGLLTFLLECALLYILTF
ncbi:CD276 antigen homolog isoform X2 [Ictalurus punctatus]|uniref:CD276 antigen homolog isoform X2 n=1 Tax=Ictalurus punctatus TaxID=7998 RepID=A0A979E4E7_ICTPU|nr:CD276 antigen homolog isoform X2 [Ictalurus punctatus]